MSDRVEETADGAERPADGITERHCFISYDGDRGRCVVSGFDFIHAIEWLRQNFLGGSEVVLEHLARLYLPVISGR